MLLLFPPKPSTEFRTAATRATGNGFDLSGAA
jgi:hypothetical protein